MKKLFSYLTVTLMVLTTALFTSCREVDEDISRNLSGRWSGVISQDVYYHRFGIIRENTSADMEFYNDPFSSFSGRGVEYDYFQEYGRLYYTESHFDYTVNMRRIYLSYDDGSDIVIRDYDMYVDLFVGVFESYDRYTRQYEDIASFRFNKIADFQWRRGGYTPWNRRYAKKITIQQAKGLEKIDD